MEIDEDDRLLKIEQKIEEIRRILVLLASKQYTELSGKGRAEIQAEIAETTEVFKFHLKCKHFLKGESFE
jgi:flagellar basal body-associated protein FliL